MRKLLEPERTILWVLVIILKTLLLILTSLVLVPRVYAITPKVVLIPTKPATGQIEAIPTVYTQAQIDEMTQNTIHPYILRTLIKCESQNTNIARLDSNGLMSYGLLQFNGTATWNEYSKLAGVVSSSPMNPTSAIRVADYMISIGELHRWSCAYITGLLKK